MDKVKGKIEGDSLKIEATELVDLICQKGLQVRFQDQSILIKLDKIISKLEAIENVLIIQQKILIKNENT